jgi:histone H2A
MSGKGAKGLAGKGAKGTMHGVDKSKAQDKKKPTSRSARAGLQFPVGRVHRLLKVRGRRLARRGAPEGTGAARGAAPGGARVRVNNAPRPALPRPA